MLNIREFPDDLHHQAKVAAATRGESLKAWITRAVQQQLEQEAGKRGSGQ